MNIRSDHIPPVLGHSLPRMRRYISAFAVKCSFDTPAHPYHVPLLLYVVLYCLVLLYIRDRSISPCRSQFRLSRVWSVRKKKMRFKILCFLGALFLLLLVSAAVETKKDEKKGNLLLYLDLLFIV